MVGPRPLERVARIRRALRLHRSARRRASHGKICHARPIRLRTLEITMGTMNVSLPDPLREFVERQVESGGYGTSSEYVRELIRRDQDRLHLRSLLLAGAKSRVTGEADAAYFSKLRSRVASKPRARKSNS